MSLNKNRYAGSFCRLVFVMSYAKCCFHFLRWKKGFVYDILQYIVTGLFLYERSMNMSGKRRDSKNRILRNGESQRRDGRYAFKYIDATGKQQFVYSWKLEKTDKTPQGKRDDISLREKEKLILKDIDDEIVPRGGEMTVLELVKKYLLQKTGVRHNTEEGTVPSIL